MRLCGRRRLCVGEPRRSGFTPGGRRAGRFSRPGRCPEPPAKRIADCIDTTRLLRRLLAQITLGRSRRRRTRIGPNTTPSRLRCNAHTPGSGPLAIHRIEGHASTREITPPLPHFSRMHVSQLRFMCVLFNIKNLNSPHPDRSPSTTCNFPLTFTSSHENLN